MTASEINSFIMEENDDDNKIIETNNQLDDLEFRFNFINIPWDDRSTKSKVGIVVLLVSIFAVTIALVVTSFFMHYRGFHSIKMYERNNEQSCFRVKMDDNRFVARIYSATSQQLLCVGAVVSPSSVLANGVCAKSGPIRIYLGSITNPRCKKGFSVDLIESIHHDGVISKRLVLLSSYESIAACSDIIEVGTKLDYTQKVYILGRPYSTGRTLSRQHVTLAGRDYTSKSISKHLKSNSTICVKDVARCPVRAGDLLLQNGVLFGLASTSVQRFSVACFGALSIVKEDLKELDTDISFSDSQSRFEPFLFKHKKVGKPRLVNQQ
ncbi:hypothetical protein PYW08_014067 [Mythimna loreyi]|uniref:Uncharacterized protein n=1 Tax=Mythimna loreyi TaxID=667449 RepID=A0ACC2R6I9_9NEOP|nr:hypothetical protein PYW08_014067 [Mythimna loreyi]